MNKKLYYQVPTNDNRPSQCQVLVLTEDFLSEAIVNYAQNVLKLLL